MKLDSENQKEFLLNLITKANITTSGGQIMNDAVQIETLKLAIASAEVEEVEDEDKVAGEIGKEA